MDVLLNIFLSLFSASQTVAPPKNNWEVVEQLSKSPTVENILALNGTPHKLNGNENEEVWTYFDKVSKKDRWIFHIDSNQKRATKIDYFPLINESSIINIETLTSKWKNCRSSGESVDQKADSLTYSCDKDKRFITESNQVTFLSVNI